MIVRHVCKANTLSGYRAALLDQMYSVQGETFHRAALQDEMYSVQGETLLNE